MWQSDILPMLFPVHLTMVV